MRKYLIYVVLLFFISFQGFAKGKVIESIEFQSKILGSTVKYSVYLPEDYEISQRNYPVIYLLHGASDDETSWIQFGEANRIFDESIEKGDFPETIAIMPDAKLTWYCNDSQMKYAWRDMFVEEFIPAIENKFRIRSKKEFRAIAGLSMGGFGALSIALNYPELFSTCVSMSGAFYSDDDVMNMSDEDYADRFSNISGIGLKGSDRINTKWKEANPFDLIQKLPTDKSNSLRFYFDCGDDDRLLKGNLFMHLKMQELKVMHELRVRNGKHEWSYWRSGLVDGLKYIGEGFHR